MLIELINMLEYSAEASHSLIDFCFQFQPISQQTIHTYIMANGNEGKKKKERIEHAFVATTPDRIATQNWMTRASNRIRGWKEIISCIKTLPYCMHALTPTQLTPKQSYQNKKKIGKYSWCEKNIWERHLNYRIDFPIK